MSLNSSESTRKRLLAITSSNHIQLRKGGIRKVGESLGLPAGSFDRIPFPGPALAARLIGETTPERIETVRKATVVVKRLLKDTGAFQYMAILHEDRVTGMRDGLRDFC